jgi:hypothetical protein
MRLFVIHSIIYGNLHPLRIGHVDFDKIGKALGVLPDSPDKIEALLQRQLGGYVRFRFRDNRGDKNGNVVPGVPGVPGNDRPIERYPFPPAIKWIFPALDAPQLRFYDAVLRAESLRVQLTLHRFSERARSDIATRKEVRGVLKSVISYLRKVAKYEDAVFGLLKLHLIGLYYEVAVAFGDVLNERHCLPFDMLFFDCFNRYPQGEEQYALSAAQYVCRAQKFLLSCPKQVDEAKELLSGLCEIMADVPRDTTLVTVAAALENFIFLTMRQLAIPAFKELTTPKFVHKVVGKQKKNLRRCCEIEETAIGRAILLEEIADELAFDFPFPIDDDLSIVHQLVVFLEEERKIYLKKPDAVFKGIAKNRQKGIEMLKGYVNRENRADHRVGECPEEYGEGVASAESGEPVASAESGEPVASAESGEPVASAESGEGGVFGESGEPDKYAASCNSGEYGGECTGEQNAFPSAETYAIRLAVTKYQTFVDTVAFYRFVELEKIKRLNADQRAQLIHRIVEMPVSYAVPMLKHLGYFDWLKKKFDSSNTFIFKHLAKALSTTERTVKGNYYVMNPCSNEDASRYNARYFMEKVVADYEDIAKEGGEDTCVPFLGR